jgi:hypothetical protein
LLLLLCAQLAFMVGCTGRHAKVGGTRQQLDFNQDVQPILASNCFSCHGPDPEMRTAGLRLDLEDSAFRKRDGKPDAIVPGHPDQSELIRRIELKDPHRLMPQTSLGEAKPMKLDEIAVLREWVAEGAHYRPHWAFEAPVRPVTPAVKDAGWVKTPIDSFILAKLTKEGMHPSPEADKPTLIRRVTLDLTGLLPTPNEVKAFQADGSPQAYEHLVDRLLASPSYGEQRARYWMDYSRFADTYGLHYDNNRYIWPYRDYLIRSFNSNKPFDQFAREQIAGDMLPAKNLDPIIGSGYVRLGLSSNEGGTIPEELRVNIARERTEAYGAAFLGLTVGCAVCHDHKYDPTTQKDFYQLSAFFNNIEEMPFNDDHPAWAPVVQIPKPANQEAYNKVLAKRSELQIQQEALRSRARAMVQQWVASGTDRPQAVSTDKLQLRLRLDEGGGDVLKNSAPHAVPASFPIGTSKPLWGETTWLWPDFRMDTSTKVVLGQIGDYEANQAFSAGGWFMLRCEPNITSLKISGALMSKMDTTQHYRGWDIATQKGIISVHLVNQMAKEIPPKDPPAPPGKRTAFKYGDTTVQFVPLNRDQAAQAKVEAARKAKETSAKGKLASAKPPPKEPVDITRKVEIKVSALKPLPIDGRWRHLFFTYDGSGRAGGVKLYVDGVQIATKAVSDTLHGATIRTEAPLQLGQRYPEADPTRATRYQDIRLYARALNPDEVKRLPYEDYVAELTNRPASQWNRDQWHTVADFYLNEVDASSKALQGQIRRLDTELDHLSQGGNITLVSRERDEIAYADVLTRGVYTARKERVEADTPHFLPPLAPGEPHNRLGLADWTVSPQNPLMARVAVNRMWYELFGTGLVETTEDFGIMGQRPSHPELLDWLAVEFRESGWDVQHMYKLMAMSAAYRQSAKATPEELANNPKNLLLAHGPRFRMDAEMLRDIALQSAGLLVNTIGGPSVKPYQPPNVWEQVGYPSSDTVKYRQDHGPLLYRRSLYTYWKRMAIMPDMDAFDAPMRDTACTRRQRTDTPLQALVTMNDVQWVEASRGLAERVIKQAGKRPEDRIKLLGDLLLARDPSPSMSAVLENSYEKMQKHYIADPEAARKLIGVGEKRADPNIPAPELAAWTIVASEMLNLDETLTK